MARLVVVTLICLWACSFSALTLDVDSASLTKALLQEVAQLRVALKETTSRVEQLEIERRE